MTATLLSNIYSGKRELLGKIGETVTVISKDHHPVILVKGKDTSSVKINDLKYLQ